MVERDTLLSTLPDEVRDSAERLYDQSADPDPHDIVAELHRQGLLRDEQLREAVLALEGSLRGVRMRAQPPRNPAPTLLGPLGAGAMGEVLLAKDEGLNRIVAVKRLLPQLASRPAVVQRFYREAQITAQLDHPSIVPIHSLVGGPDGSLAYSMKLVRGCTLEDWLDQARQHWRAHGRESRDHLLSDRLERFLQICEAIAYAHDRGVVHRDLKPENVMIGTFGQVLVMDWGIAKVLQQAEVSVDGEAPKSVGGTRAGSVFGTPRYMSPEQAAGANDKVDGRSDQYALGLILFELVALQPAIPENLELEACLAWAESARKRPMTHVHRKGVVPRELAAIVDKATARDPGRRYPNVQALAEDVRRYLRDEAVLARPDTMVQRMHRWAGHHRTAMLATVCLLGLLLVVTGTTLLIGSTVALEWRRRVALRHEEAVTEVLSLASVGAGRVERAMGGAEAALIGLSYAAEAGLDRKDAGQGEEPSEPSEERMRFKLSPVYDRKVSLERPSFAGPARSEELDRQMQRLDEIAHSFARPLLDSATEERLNRAQRFEQIARKGAPIRWVKIATSAGLVATMPGTGPFASGVDGRRLDWYRDGEDPDVRWSSLHVDPDGTGLVLTGTRPLYRLATPIGTAAIDLTAQTLVDLLDPPPGAREALLVDGQGQVVVWAALDAPGAKSYAPKELPLAELKDPLREKPEGVLEVGDTIAAWAPIDVLGWRYLVLVDSSGAGEVKARWAGLTPPR